MSPEAAKEPRLADALNAAITLSPDPPPLSTFSGESSISDIEKVIQESGSSVARVLSDAALSAHRTHPGATERNDREGLTFIVAKERPKEELTYTVNSVVSWHLAPETVAEAVRNANRMIELIHDIAAANEAPVFHLLGLRNLSSFVGEIFASALKSLYTDCFLQNPNQDGHPDLIALTPEGQEYITKNTTESKLNRDKTLWSPFPYGGVEVKATCGNTPPAKEMAKREIGESRIDFLVSAEWKAHHRETNFLLGVFWDFVDELPTILAAFYRNDLTEDDWGTVVTPKEGSRTTSVSIMTKAGVAKMGKGWVVLPEDLKLRDPLTSSKVFGTPSDIIAKNSGK